MAVAASACACACAWQERRLKRVSLACLCCLPACLFPPCILHSAYQQTPIVGQEALQLMMIHCQCQHYCCPALHCAALALQISHDRYSLSASFPPAVALALALCAPCACALFWPSSNSNVYNPSWPLVVSAASFIHKLNLCHTSWPAGCGPPLYLVLTQILSAAAKLFTI